MAYAFNQVASDKRPTARASEILERMKEFRAANPDQAIPLSGEELNVLMSVDAEVVRRMYGDLSNETRTEFNERLMAADSPFIGFSGSKIEISGAGTFNGIHRAEDINYYYVGMVTAASNRSWFLMHGYIEAYNLNQFRMSPSWHDIRQMPPAKRWARAGYSHYSEGD